MSATTPQTNASLKDIVSELRAGDDFVITGHVSPDGDCLGSQLALAHTLRQMGKRAVCVLAKDDPLDRPFSLLPGASDMVPAALYEGACDVFLAVDVPTVERIGDAARLLEGARLSITVDHHAVDTTMTDLVHVEPAAPATALMVWEMCLQLVGRPTSEAALCAYAGLATDTGCFQFQNADASAFSGALSMVEHGADPAFVAREFFQYRTLASMRLEALAIERAVFSCGGRCVVSFVSAADMERLGAVKADTEPLVDALRKIAGVEVAVMLREQDGSVRGSARAKDAADVSVLARGFGGGGHTAAAGFTVEDTLEGALDQVLARIDTLYGASA
ncbi:MAG: DHHA1 domain-containing protein [Berryella intestinalis]|uniref:DHH family phosphoesterase n=1 Tax=Berryella intestinalis TaxID=1531429 RepID=UPI002A763C64|nr:DHH family phosphoesterase [Berryella intestinalis]MDY3129402.1 DHHA1 domain-containing protein [Berryella intestinalis]